MSAVAARLEARRVEDGSSGAAPRADNATVASGNHAAAAAFLASFEQRRREMENALSKLSVEAAAPGASVEAGKQSLALISSSLSSLSADTSAHGHLLPAYDLRATKLALSALEEAVSATQSALQPRKKFAFKKQTYPSAKAAAAAQSVAADSNSVRTAPAAAFPAAPEHLPPEDSVTGFYRHTNKVLVKAEGQGRGVDVMLSHLTDCVVFLLEPPSALRCHNLVRCHVYAAPCSGSVLIYGARDCTFHLSTRQLRIHDTHESIFRLHALSAPIIEHTDSTAFGAADFDYPARSEHMSLAGLDGTESKHETVEDFNWLRTQQSPNWRRVTPEDEQKHKAVSLTQEHTARMHAMRDDQVDDEQVQKQLQELVQELHIR